jgi:hypothetical protein
MFKQLIAPVQKWLLKHKQCVGCGRSLNQAKQENKKGKLLTTCVCGRIYVQEGGQFRRALFEEA